MPALNTSPAALDDVENAAQRGFQDGQQAFRQSLFRQMSGDQMIADTGRQNFLAFNQAQNAVIAQALLGSDPTLAQSILAERSTQAQPNTTGGLVMPGVVSGVPAAGNTSPAQPIVILPAGSVASGGAVKASS